MNENDFMRQQQAAVERMKEMNARATPRSSGQPMPPAPQFVRLQNGGNRQSGQPRGGQRQETRASSAQQGTNRPTAPPEPRPQPGNPPEKQSGGLLSGLGLPFLDRLSSEKDVSLILGLLLILLSEKADKKLLFALVYILL